MINQIHSETYFSTIRASLGGCTNPTTVQFTSAYKKLLFGACNKTKYGNCILQDDSKLLLFPNCKPVKAADEIVQSLCNCFLLFKPPIKTFMQRKKFH